MIKFFKFFSIHLIFNSWNFFWKSKEDFFKLIFFRFAAEGREAAGRAAALGTQGLASWKKEKTHFSGEFSGYAASGSFIEGKWTKKARCKNNKK